MVPTVCAPVLAGSLIRLEPLSIDHAADLARAAEEDRSSYSFTLVPHAADMTSYLDAQLARIPEGLTPFAQIRRSDGSAVGCTAFWNPRVHSSEPDRLQAIEIGWTWLGASSQGQNINVESKMLLFSYAFDVLNVARVDLKTDARNERSRRAIAGVGAKFEGVLRSWSPSWAPGEEGMLRDSAMFSVVHTEWPVVKQSLSERVRGRRGSIEEDS